MVDRLKQCQDIEFKRHYFSEHINDPIVHIYLHGFSDASEVAYAACKYLKYITKMGDIGIKFLTAKSRIVSARKAFTVRRLESLGNLILAKLMSSVKGALCDEIVINDISCHTDSMITLTWIQSGKKLKPFEETRVQKIRENVNPNRWFHCKSEENPADVITRFTPLDDDKSNLFYNGPLFLKNFNEEKSIEVNMDIMNKIVNDYTGEVIRDNITRHTLINSKSDLVEITKVIDTNKYSNLRKLFEVTGWMLRFVNNLKSKIRRGILISDEHLTLDEYNHSH